MSTNPGVTDRPRASISSAPEPVTVPTAAILPSLTATSASNGVPPLPSMTVPPRMTTSYVWEYVWDMGRGLSTRGVYWLVGVSTDRLAGASLVVTWPRLVWTGNRCACLDEAAFVSRPE